MSECYIIDDFKLFGGIHCETSAVRKVFQYHGLSISEEMLFGLGGGIGFIYWYMKMMPAPVLGARGGGRYFIENAARRAGATIEVRRTSSNKKGHKWLMEKLANDEPTVIYADMAYLPYMGVPEDAHFGQHVFVIYGVDEANDVVYISDRGKRGVTVNLENLRQARSSKFPPWPPHHATFDFTLPEELEVKADSVRNALQECVNGMLDAPIRNIGLEGYKKWADLVVKWPKLFPDEKLWDPIYQSFIYIETGGTGGSAMRPMFSRFLAEAMEILDEPSLEHVIAKYNESARVYSKIAKLMLPDEYPILRRVRELLLELNRVFEAQKPDTMIHMQEIGQEMESSKEEILAALARAPDFLPAVQEQILRLYEVEKEAIHMLRDVIM